MMEPRPWLSHLALRHPDDPRVVAVRRAPALSRSALCAWLGLVACAAPAPAPRSADAPATATLVGQSEAERFLPLKHDTVFSYAAWLSESPHPEQLILQVERRSPERASLRSGNSIKRIELSADGARLLGGGYLLKVPLTPGARWTGPAGQVRISGMNQAVQVQAGHFVGCLETTELAGPGSANARAIVTTYCPEVGIVKFRIDAGERQEKFELKSFGPRVDVDDL
jgi:hypothetical protein